jgi:hypothetical protein
MAEKISNCMAFSFPSSVSTRGPIFSRAMPKATDTAITASDIEPAASVSAGLYTIMSTRLESRKSDVTKVPMAEPVSVRCTVFTEPMRIARSPLA